MEQLAVAFDIKKIVFPGRGTLTDPYQVERWGRTHIDMTINDGWGNNKHPEWSDSRKWRYVSGMVIPDYPHDYQDNGPCQRAEAAGVIARTVDGRRIVDTTKHEGDATWCLLQPGETLGRFFACEAMLAGMDGWYGLFIDQLMHTLGWGIAGIFQPDPLDATAYPHGQTWTDDWVRTIQAMKEVLAYPILWNGPTRITENVNKIIKETHGFVIESDCHKVSESYDPYGMLLEQNPGKIKFLVVQCRAADPEDIDTWEPGEWERAKLAYAMAEACGDENTWITYAHSGHGYDTLIVPGFCDRGGE